MRRIFGAAAAVAAVGIGLCSGVAGAQSAELLEAVRLQRPGALNLARGEWTRCLALKDACATRSGLGMLVASLELSAGNPEGARELLQANPAPALLDAHHAFLLGQAHFYARAPLAAAEAFLSVEKTGSGSLVERARLRRAEALLAGGKDQDALVLFEKLTKRGATPEVLRQRAEARARRKKLTEAVQDLRALAVRHPTHAASADVLTRIEKLTGKAPSFSFEERLRRAEAFLGAGEPARAIDECAAATSRSAGEAARLELVRAQALFARKDEEAAQLALDLAAKGPTEVAASVALFRARRAMKAEASDAPAQLAAVDEAFPGTRAAEEAGFFSAWLNFQRGEFEDSMAAFERFDTRHAESRRLDETQWYRALAELRLGRSTAAAKRFDALVAAHPRSSLVPQARYWAVRARQLAGEKAERLGPEFEKLIALYPASFYARLSEERLRELGRAAPRPFAQRPTILEVEPPASLALALALNRAGQFAEALEEVRAQTSRVRGADQALAFAHSLRALGEFGHAYSIAARHLWGRAFGDREPDALSLLFPLAFESTVRSAAKSVEMDPNFVWAIMRRESAFKDWVASAADARGLMQIIPPTARRIAESLSEPAPSADALFAPAMNVRYGAWYLSALLQRFGHPALAAAAYNAGPEVVAKWYREKSQLPLDQFVEEIPYKETRGYVKQVLADLHLYHALYGDPAAVPSLELKLPTTIASGVTF